jgi:protein O-mannosyl-transferase
MRLPPTWSSWYRWVLAATFVATMAAYWPGLTGGFLFDDYPNIVDNRGVQPQDASVPSLVSAALSSPSSEFKRPLASLSFAANYLATGLDPYWMKLTNLIIHLLNGLLVFFLSRALLRSALFRGRSLAIVKVPSVAVPLSSADSVSARQQDTKAEVAVDRHDRETTQNDRSDVVASLITSSWMLLPINLTGVLYVVQRMESMANLFVLLGLIGYVAGRQRMLGNVVRHSDGYGGMSLRTKGFLLSFLSITLPTALGILAKETAVMLPLYAALAEWILFRFAKPTPSQQNENRTLDFQVVTMFLLVLVIPMLLGLAWILPGLLRPSTWAIRDFTMETRLLSEARIIVDYIVWTLIPTPNSLSFYHDDFQISTGLLAPWTTVACMLFLAALFSLVLWLRSRRPLAALGIALFLGCQMLTGTIIPLELIYEHRNYFASFGLILAIVPLLSVPRAQSFALPRHILLVGLLLCWATLTLLTARAWGDPLTLAEDLALRAPESPRAQYELGRTYIIYSHYDPTSPFAKLAYAPLEKAAALPHSSILPEQALIFMNSRMHLPLKDAWWVSMITKLKTHKPGVQDESSLGALTQCAREHHCNLPADRMTQAFMAALSHPRPSARLLAAYGDYAWSVLNAPSLGEHMMAEAVRTAPHEPAYQITLIRMLLAQNRISEATKAIRVLQTLNFGGRLNEQIQALETQAVKYEDR